MERLTIYDISQLAGVSVTTVSRVLNGNSNVNPETRARVERVIREHGYVPKQSARNFGRQELYAVGLMMNDVRHAYMSELAYAINQELYKWKVNMVLCNIVDVEKEFINQVDNLIEKRVNGVILLGSIFENPVCKVAIERRYSEFPFVAVNANFALPNVCEVLQDQYQGARDAVRYLYGLGRRRIGWVYYHRSRSDQKKHAGFLSGMQECGLMANRLEEVEGRTLEQGKAATAALMERFPDTDTLIYSGDILAVGGAHYLNSQGITIPDQVALVGFNNSSLARECYPPLTSIDNKIADSGRLAAQTILNILNKQETENIMVPCGLVVRDSTIGKGDKI